MFSETTSKPPTAVKPAGTSSAKNTYLLAYNALSAVLWVGLLTQTVTIGAHEIGNARKAGAFFGGDNALTAIKRGLSSGKVFKELETYTRWVQTLAGLEVFHSLAGQSMEHDFSLCDGSC